MPIHCGSATRGDQSQLCTFHSIRINGSLCSLLSICNPHPSSAIWPGDGFFIHLADCQTAGAMNGPSPMVVSASVSPPVTTTMATSLMTSVGVARSVPMATASGVDGLAALQSTACGARQLAKLKRFLTTLQQFGSDISPDVGERVQALILGLVNGALAVDEFHHKLQETTNFPLRPFVIPFLKTNLPLLQRELVHCARVAKQTPQQFLLHQRDSFLVVNSSPPLPLTTPVQVPVPIPVSAPALAPVDKPLPLTQSTANMTTGSTHKRKNSIPAEAPPPSKRSHTTPNSLSPTSVGVTSSSPSPASASAGMLHTCIPLRLDDMALFRDMREPNRHERDFRRYGFPPARDAFEDAEDEWMNIHTMLNCILGMVEKTKSALAILQQRSATDRQELATWLRRPGPQGDSSYGSNGEVTVIHDTTVHGKRLHSNGNNKCPPAAPQPIHQSQQPQSAKRPPKRPLSTYSNGSFQEDGVADAKLHMAVAAAEAKANELVAAEKAKMDRMIVEARRQAAEEALAALNQQEDSNENCWNCGRKASETCSGCNLARYCGSFCQHKDWENHHHVCGQQQQRSASGSSRRITSPSGVMALNAKAVTAESKSK